MAMTEKSHGSDLLRAAAAVLLLCCVAGGAIFVIFSDDMLCPGGAYCGLHFSAAVSGHGGPCAAISTDILKAGGTAADGAIAAMFCSGVVNPTSMGVGGGFFLTYYDRTEGKAYALNAREMAPAAATRDMFKSNSSLSLQGGLAVAVPGEVRGYTALYNRFGGGVEWSKLLEPAIKLCEEGNPINVYLAESIMEEREQILAEPSLSFLVSPATGDVLREGDLLKLPTLASTLRVLQQEPDALYTGSLAPQLVQDLQEHGAIITLQDLQDYQAVWSEPVNVTLHDNEGQTSTMYSVPPPGSGAVLAFILNVLDEYGFTESSLSSDDELLTYQRITETFKYAYALRTFLGDAAYVDIEQLVANMTSDDYARMVSEQILVNATSTDPAYYGAYSSSVDDHGTSHVSVLSEAGDAVAATSTINTSFGALFASPQTGVIFNNEMDDFSSPNITNFFGVKPSPANFIEPGKRPLSSMCPAIVVGASGDVRLVVGAAGGTRITTAVAQVILMQQSLGMSVSEAVAAKRIHHQLQPMQVWAENEFNKRVVSGLRGLGHDVIYTKSLSTVGAVSRETNGRIWASVDPRRNAVQDGY